MKDPDGRARLSYMQTRPGQWYRGRNLEGTAIEECRAGSEVKAHGTSHG